MRRIVANVFVSLDGVMQAPGGPTEDPTNGFAQGGWVAPHFDEEGGAAIGRFFAQSYDLLLGRRTYDIFAAYWPFAEGENAAMGEAFTAANKVRADPRRSAITLGEQSPAGRHRRGSGTEGDRRPRPDHPGVEHALPGRCSPPGCSTDSS